MTDATTAAAPKIKFSDMTKEQKLAKIDADIAKLNERRQAIVEGREVKATKAPAYVPEVGAAVLATVGRNTATSQAKVVEAVVVAIKAPADGEKGGTQVRIRIGSGFDEQLVTVYPAQLKPNVAAMPDEVSDERALGELPQE
jgi:hypothetical protein